TRRSPGAKGAARGVSTSGRRDESCWPMPSARSTNMRDTRQVRRFRAADAMSRLRRSHGAARVWLLLLGSAALSGLVSPAVSCAALPVADSLAATADPPWNPPSAMPPRRPWEQAVLLPGRIVSLPLVGVGEGLRGLTGWLESQERIPTEPQGPRLKRTRLVSLH